jgi:hypothetical protein
LVAFADGGSLGIGIGVSAWFPLGPRDPFIPWYHHDDVYLRRVNERNVRGVADINLFVHQTNIVYAHRTAMTVVPAATFAAGRPVAREAIRVSPDRLAMARIAPHPGVVPAREAVFGGVRAPRPPTAIDRRLAPREPVARAVPPTRGGVTAVPRPLVMRAPPAAAVPSIESRQQAMQQHPGRPLEPQQMQNLRAGRPAGPSRDVEAPHPQRGKEPAKRPERKEEKKPA